MLNEIKVPAEVIEVQNRANDLAQKYAASQQRKIDQLRAECAAKLAEIQIPPEVAEILKQIDHQRGMVRVFQEAQERDILKAIEEKRAELFEQAKRETEQVYKDLAERKAEIEAEFAGKEADAAANIAKLEAEIKKDVIERASKKLEEDIDADDLSVKSAHFHAVYNRGRVTWKTDNLDKLGKRFAAIVAEIDTFVAMTEELAGIRKKVSEIARIVMEARKEGEPSVSIRRNK